jgi:hypothetical protein
VSGPARRDDAEPCHHRTASISGTAAAEHGYPSTRPHVICGSNFGRLLVSDPGGAGELLRTVLWLPDMLQVLPDGCGWTDGGCLILADALHRLVQPAGRLVAIVDRTRGQIAQHVLLELPGPDQVWYLDGDGASSSNDVLQRWRTTEALARPLLAPLHAAHLHEQTPRSSQAAQALARQLAALAV